MERLLQIVCIPGKSAKVNVLPETTFEEAVQGAGFSASGWDYRANNESVDPNAPIGESVGRLLLIKTKTKGNA